MKFCQNCGAEMPDDGMFCANCGTKATDTTAQPVNPETVQQPVENSAPQQPVNNNSPQQPVNGNAPQQPVYGYAPQQPVNGNAPQQPVYGNVPQQPIYGYAPQQPIAQKPPKKPMSKKAKIIILCCALVVIAAVVAIVCIVIHNKNKKETIDIMEYVTVEYSGYNTIGKAEVNFDEDAFAEAVLEAQGKDISDDDIDDMDDLEDLLNSSSDYYEAMESVEDLLYCIEFTVTPEDGLSNGDNVTVSVEYDEDIVDDNDIILKADDTEFTVEGLSDVTEVNPFDYVDVTFEGTAPNAYADIDVDKSQDIFSYIYYTVDKDSGLNIGDKITVSFGDDYISYAEENGFKLTETSKEYTVENVDHYISTVEDIVDDTLESMKKDAEDEITSYFDNNDSYIAYKDLKYMGMYFLNANDVDTWGDVNDIYVIYSATVSSKDDDFEDTTVYLPVLISDLIELQDGTQEYDSYLYIEGNTDLEFGWWDDVLGYTAEKDMFAELITDKSDYTGVVSGDLKDFNKASDEEETTTTEETTTAGDVEDTTTAAE